ncbi:MAG: hypothetical protein ACOY3Z_01005 [Thermodesulfobacteriota bacterium]
MRGKTTKKSIILACLLFLVQLPCLATAVLNVQSELISGRIMAFTDDKAVKLDNGVLYRPSRQGVRIQLQPGDVVTLRYYTESTGQKVYFEYAPGANSLQPMQNQIPPGRVVRPGY